MSNGLLQLEFWLCSVDRSIARPLDRSIVRSLVRSIARPLDRSLDPSIARSLARSLDRSLDRSTDRSRDRSSLHAHIFIIHINHPKNCLPRLNEILVTRSRFGLQILRDAGTQQETTRVICDHAMKTLLGHRMFSAQQYELRMTTYEEKKGNLSTA